MKNLRPIVIVEYRPSWPSEFNSIAPVIRDAIQDLALRIDHIGSTSVPGLHAKDVIDIQITVSDFTAELESRFVAAGFTRGEHNHDHVPPAQSGSARDWEKQMYLPVPGTRPTNIHVRRAGSRNGRYALLFRDYLRSHPLAARAYGQAKMALSKHGPTDWDLYYDVKDPICDIIMAGAEDWAAASDWHPEHYS